MSHSTRSAIPFYRNPQLLPGAVALMAWMLEHNYCHREEAARYVTAHGEVSGLVDRDIIDRGDLETAEAAFVEALEVVPDDSPAWNDPAVFLDADSLLEPRGAVAIGPPDGFDEALARFEALHPVRSPLPESFRGPDAWQIGGEFPPVPAPIRGGSPDAGRHSPESLARVNLAVYGTTEPLHA